MNILFVTSVYGKGLGGRENCVWKIASLLSEKHSVKVVARSDRPFNCLASLKDFTSFCGGASSKSQYLDGKVEVNILSGSQMDRMKLGAVYKLRFCSRTQATAIRAFSQVFADKLKPFVEWADLVQYDGTGWELLGYSVMNLSVAMDKPLVIQPYAHMDSWGDGILDIDLYKKADAVITQTEYEKEAFSKRGLDREKISVMPNGPILFRESNADYFTQEYGVPDGFVLFVGRKGVGKGYHALIEATKYVWREKNDVHFVFMGRGKSKGMDPRIIEMENASEYEKASAYAACGIFCMPSAAESFGITYIEAWAMGKPVIGGDIPALREVIGDSGLLVSQNPREIAKAILRLLGDKSLRERLGDLGRLKVLEKYNWESILQKVEDLYVNLLRVNGERKRA